MKKITFILAVLIAMTIKTNAQWISTNGPIASYVSCFVVNGSSIFAGTSGNGVFLSTNNGTTWTAVNTGLNGRYIRALAFNGTNLFAGTVDGGVFLSTNNGGSWTSVNTGLTNTSVQALAVNGTYLYAGTAGGGVFVSTNNGTGWTAVNTGLTNTNINALAVNGTNLYAGTFGSGVFLLTNNGTSWSPANTGISNTYINSIAIYGASLFAGTYGGGVLVSQNNGNSWNQVNSGLTNLDAMTLAFSGSTLYVGTKNGGIFKSTNLGSSWNSVNTGLPSSTIRSIGVSGANLFAGTSAGVYFSTNNGTNWTVANTGLKNNVISALFKSGTNLFAGTLSGIFISPDNGLTWNQTGLQFTNVQAIAANGTYIFAGTWDGVYRSADNGASWTQVNTGLVNADVNTLIVSGTNIFAGTAGGGIFLSTDNGANWTQLNNGLTNTNVNSIIINGANIFAGTNNGAFLSTNNGTSWTPIIGGLTNTEIHVLLIDGTNLFAGTANGVFLSTNNGTSWTQLNSGLYVSSLAINGTKLYAGSWKSVWVTANNGLSWTLIDGGFTTNTFNLVKSLFVSGTDLYAGTEGDGVWKLHSSISDGQWTQQNTLMAGTSIVADQISVVDSNIVWVNGVNKSGTGRFAQAMARTKDGGITWTPGAYNGFGPNVFPGVLSAVSYNKAFCCAWDTVTSEASFWKTVDGGANWSLVTGVLNTPPTTWPDGVKFWDNGKGFSWGDPVNNHFDIYTTSDSGATWTHVPDANNPVILTGEYGYTNPMSTATVEGGIGFFMTSKGRIYKTTDYGLTWSITPSNAYSATTSSTGGIVAASSANNIIFYYNTTPASLKYTSNGGATWDTLAPSGYFYQYQLCHVPHTPNMFVGTARWSNWKGTAYSNDGGLNWTDFTDNTYLQPGGVNALSYGVGFYNPPLTATASSNAPSICMGSSSQINVAASSGSTYGWVGNKTSPFTINSILNIKYSNPCTYLWSSSPAGFTSNAKNPTVSPSVTTTYTVTVSNGTSSTTSSVVVTVSTPTVQATSFTASSIADYSMTAGFTRGNGTSVLVVARQGSAVNTVPVNGTTYTASAAFGSGSEIGTGNFVVYSGTGSSVNITALASGTTYYYAVYEYNLANKCYLLPALTGNAATTGINCSILNYLASKAQDIPGSYVDLGSNGSVITTSDFDDANSAAQNIGFNFNYNCQMFTQFVLNTNGFIKLGNTPPSGAALFFDTPQTAGNGIFNSTSTADVNLISAFNHDLMAGTGTPEYRVSTSGVAPNRICTIQYKNVRDKTTTPAQQYDNMQFQIKLYETSNIIEIVYGDWTPSANASAYKTSACGLKGSSNADNELLVVNKGSTQSWDAVSFSNANYSTTATLNFGNPTARPKPDAGRTFRFNPKQNNDLAVGEIYALGDASLYFSNPQHISANIVNGGYNTMTNVPVTLTVTGANSFSNIKYIPSISANQNVVVTFDDFTATADGTTNITISLPNDDYNADNTKTWIQNTNDFICDYSAPATALTGYGFNILNEPTQSASGIFYAKYHITGSAIVNAVKAFINNNDANNAGQTIYGTVSDESGAIVGQSDNYVIQAGDLGTWHTFTINTPSTITNAYFYAGLACTVGSTVYHPMGIQYENPSRSGAFYHSAIDGSNLVMEDSTTFTFRFMLGAILSPIPPVAGTASSDATICGGNTSPINLSGYTGNIHWQQSADGTSNWTNVSGGTGGNTANYTTAGLTVTTYYRAEVTEPSFPAVYSNVITITVNPSPTVQVTLFTSSALTINSTTVGWTRGNGTGGVIVIAREDSAVNTAPDNGTAYTANAAFGSGTEIGTGNYVVYNGTGTSVNITALTSGTTYYYAIYEYTSGTDCYLTPPLTGNATTIGTPPCPTLSYLAFKAQDIPGSYVDLGLNGAVITTTDFDDANSTAQNIGFTFEYNCQSFTQFILNTNGFIKLGSSAPSSAALFFDGAQTAGAGIFNSTNPADVNLISPFNHDLTAGTGTPEYRVYTSGTAPNRICTIQFKNVRDKTTTPAQQYDNMQFQIKLYETTKIIEFVYGDWTPSANASAFKTSACGLKGSSNADNQLLVVNKGSVASWDAVSFTNANYSTTATLNFGNPTARPKPDAGRTYRFIPTYNNDLAVGEIYAMGDASLSFSNPQHIATNIMNTGYNTMTNVPVTLTITGANSFTDTQYISSLNSGGNAIVTFANFTATSNGSTSIVVSLPNDDYNVDNSKTWTQNTNNYTCNYSSTANPSTNYGFAVGNDGIFNAKYHVTGTANVNSVKVYIANDAGSVGQTVFGVVIDENGSIVGQSGNYIIQTGDLGGWHTFSINTPPTIVDAYFYAGFALTAGTTAYYPMGVQKENPPRSDAYFYSAIDGSGLIQYDPATFPYRFMIAAVLSPTPPVAGTATSNTTICSGNTASMALTGYFGSIQWQQSADGSTNWTNVSTGTGANAANYTTGNLTVTTYYRAEVTLPSFPAVHSNIITVTVIIPPSAPIVGTITQPTCALATGSVILNGLPTGNWTINPGTITGSTISKTISNLAAGTYSYTVTNASGCTSLASLNIVINTQPVTPSVINQSTSILTGGTFIVSPSGVPVGTTYTWIAPTYTGGVTGGSAQTIPQSNISGSLTIPSGNGTATYTVIPASGSCVGLTFTVTVTVTSSCVPVTVGTQPANNSMCTSSGNASFTVVANGTFPYTYQWQYNNSGTWANVANGTPTGTLYTNATTGTLSATGTTAPGSYQYRCYITNCSGANNATSATVTLTVNATPVAPTASATLQPTCTVSTGTISITAPTGTGMTYSIDGSTYTNTTGVFTFVTAGTYTVTAKNSTGCISSGTSVTINIQPSTPAAPTASATLQPTCAVSTGTITVTAPIGTGMTYSIDGSTYTNTTGVFTSVAEGLYIVTAKNPAGCISSGTSVTINTQPPTPAAPTASATLQPTCAIATGTITITAPTGTGMTYSIDGSIYTNTTGVFAFVAAGTYTVTAKNADGCISSGTSVTINAQPATPNVTDQTISILTGGTFIVTPSGVPVGTTYTWTAPTYTGGVTGGSAQTIPQSNISGSLTIPSGNGTATYTVTPASGSCVGLTFTVTVTVTTTCAPVTIGTQPANNSMCATSGNASFTVSANGTFPFTYQWQYNNSGTWVNVANGTPTGSSYNNTTSGTLDVAGISTAGSSQYRCFITNCSGANNATSAVATLTVNAPPTAPTVGTITQPTCALATGSVILNGLPTGNWTINPGNISGTGTSTTISSLATGTYNFTVTNASGCTSVASNNVAINTQPATPATPIITLNNNILHADATSGNQWYDQNGPVNLATNQDYTVIADGYYYDIVTLLGCSSDTSNIIHVELIGIEQTHLNSSIKVYPNPVSNELIIEIEGNKELVNYEIYSSLGQVVSKGSVINKTIVQTESFATGVYLIKLANGKMFEYKKIVKE